MKTYLVGGAVRDKLLSITPKERDFVVVGGSPEAMGKLGFKPVGKDFPVFLHPETKEEYALARKEKKDGHGYRGFEFYTDPSVTLKEDLLRRDLTINAMAEDDNGALIDPYGGKQDLEKQLLRHVSGAFVEDPLRVLRVARFYARFKHLGFTVAPDTLDLMRQVVASGELEHLTAERVWQEMERAMGERTPAAFVEVMRECGALSVLLPEIDSLFGIPQRADYHPEVDTGTHLLMSLNMAAKLTDDSQVRFAVLVHDLGKALTPTDVLSRHIGHEESGVPLVEKLCSRFRIPNKYRELAILVCRYHLLSHTSRQLRPATLLKLLENLDAYRRPNRFAQFLLACEADARGRAGKQNDPYPAGEWLAKAHRETSIVSPQPFLEQGLKGSAIANAIQQERLAIIKLLKAG